MSEQTEETPIAIYVLRDPRDDQSAPLTVRYVGISRDPVRRLDEHIKYTPRYSHHNGRWVAKLQHEGVNPTLSVIEWVSAETWREREPYWIQFYKDAGARLTNGCAGGLGVINPSPETRAKMAAARRGKKLAPEHKAKLLDALRKARERMTREDLINRGRNGAAAVHSRPAEERKKSYEKQRISRLAGGGWIVTPIAREKIRQAHALRWQTLTADEKARQLFPIHNLRPETRARRNAAIRERWVERSVREHEMYQSEEFRAKMRIMSAAAYAKATPEQLSEKGRKATRKFWGSMTAEERSDRMRKIAASMTPEERSAKAKKMWETIRAQGGEEGRGAKIAVKQKARWATIPREQRSAPAQAYYDGLTEEQKAVRNAMSIKNLANAQEGIKKMSPEAKASRIAKSAASRRATMAAMSPEEKEAWYHARSETRKKNRLSKPTAFCSEHECPNEVSMIGLCSMHYNAVKRQRKKDRAATVTITASGQTALNF